MAQVAARRVGDEAKGGQRSAPGHRRPPSPAPSAVLICSPSVVNGSGHAAMTTSRRTAAAALHQCPSPCFGLSVRALGGGVPAPPSCSDGNDDDDEATSWPKKKYEKWDMDDERKILFTLAKPCGNNPRVPPKAAVLLKKICDDGGLLHRGVDATKLAYKVHTLKKKFLNAAPKLAAKPCRGLRKYRNRVLYKKSMKLWSHLLPDNVAAAVQDRLARVTPWKRP